MIRQTADSLWMAYQDHPTEANRDRLIESLLPIASLYAKRYAKQINRKDPAVTVDDLYADLSIVIMQSIDTYDPDQGATLTTWAGRCCQYEINDKLERPGKRIETVSIHGIDPDAEDFAIRDDIDPDRNISAIDYLRRKAESLTGDEREIAMLVIDEGLSADEVAKRRGITRKKALWWMDEIGRKLGNILEMEDA